MARPCPHWPECGCDANCDAVIARRARPGFWFIAGALLAVFAIGAAIAFVGPLS